MAQQEHIVNLDLAPEERWSFLANYSKEVDELLECYLNDFTGAEIIFDTIGTYKTEFVSKELLSEIDSIASQSKFSANQVLIANLYYDILKSYFGCTAFAVATHSGVFHARNLDWHTYNNLLSRHSMVFDFQKQGQTVFKTVGWPGFVGTLSGTRPGKFSVTLNAVSSADPAEIAIPISFLLRNVLATAETFKEAQNILENTQIASDCLLLLSGTDADDLVVIERTPKRFATREASNQHIAVTNDYKKLHNVLSDGSELRATSCGRYDRALKLLSQQAPDTHAKCLKVLQDESVMMGITVQQMVFNNSTGEITPVKTNLDA